MESLLLVALLSLFPMPVSINAEENKNHQSGNKQDNDSRPVLPDITHKVREVRAHLSYLTPIPPNPKIVLVVGQSDLIVSATSLHLSDCERNAAFTQWGKHPISDAGRQIVSPP